MGGPSLWMGLPKGLGLEIGEPNRGDRFFHPGGDRRPTTSMVRCPLGQRHSIVPYNKSRCYSATPMYALVSRDKTELRPGTVIRIPGTWSDYCAIRESRGDGSVPRIKFRNSEILLMSPLLRHGREAHQLAGIVAALLESQEQNYEAFTPITMDSPGESGIEPDYCFYIDNWQAVAGKDRIDWQVDPPPDLAIEIDVTSYTAPEDFLPYKVPEIWIFKHSGLKIYRLIEAAYIQQDASSHFPNANLPDLIDRLLTTAAEKGTGLALQELRSKLTQNKN
jgi:Uma2 family endonuclease